jgi:replicative DNA helicase
MHNTISERGVIGVLLIKPDCFDEIDLVADDFYLESHRIAFQAISRMCNTGMPVDVITLAEKLDSDGDLTRIGGLPYLGDLAQSAPSASNIKHYATAVRNSALLRELNEISQDIAAQTEKKADASEIAEMAERRIFSVMEKRGGKEPVMLSEALEEALIHVEERYSGASIAMPTGLVDLDELLGGGFHRGSLNILAARPKMGKTALACTMAVTAARAGGVVYFASLEMPRREIANRMIAITSGFPTDAIMHDHNATDAVTSAIGILRGLKIILDDECALTIGKLRSRTRKAQRKYGLQMVVVDYLQLMRGDGSNREQEIASISRGLKGLSKELDCPVLCLAQVNRECESRTDKRPHMSDLRESGAIEQDADLVMMIYRDEVYNKESDMKGVAEVLIRANRHGANGEVFCQFDGHLTRFKSLDKCWKKPEPQKCGRGL